MIMSLLEYYQSMPMKLGPILFCVDFTLLLSNLFDALVALSLISKSVNRKVTDKTINIGRFGHIYCSLVITTSFYVWGLYRNGFIKPEYKNAALLLPRLLMGLYTLFSISFLRKILYGCTRLGPDRELNDEQEKMKHDMIHFRPPSKTTINTLVSPLSTIFQPEVVGIEHVSTSEPSLFVMNHSLYGMEAPTFVNILYQEKDIYPRGLADRMLFNYPMGEMMRAIGAVDGTRENGIALMESQQNVLVYPGGCHEVMKPSNVPRYTLMWKERLGFARLAIRYGYPIQPCAAVGTEDMLDIMMDIPAGFLRNGFYVPVLYPITPVKLQKIYYWFGEHIPTKHYNGDWENDDYAREVRDKAKASIEEAIQQLQQRQANDPDRFFMQRFANQILKTNQSVLNVFKDRFRWKEENREEGAREERENDGEGFIPKEKSQKNHSLVSRIDQQQ